MGFLDKLLRSTSNLSKFDPLFGGLIPRREIDFGEDEFVRENSRDRNQRAGLLTSEALNQNQQQNNTLLRLSNNPGFEDRNKRPDNIVFDWTEQELGLKKKTLDLEREKFGLDQTRVLGDLSDKSKQREFDRNKLGQDKEINDRKQALDEWKAKNPEGQIQIGEDGKVHVVNKVNGRTIDTGLTADHFNDEEKIKLQQKYNIDLEDLRQGGREDLEKLRQGKGERISPTQQRAAEIDALNEMINEGSIPEHLKDYFGAEKETGKLLINRPKEESAGFFSKGRTSNEAMDLGQQIDDLEAEFRNRIDKRLNKKIGVSKGDEEETEMIDMIAPDGIRKLKVPKGEVEDLKSKGATLPLDMEKINKDNEEDRKNLEPAEGMEFTYNRAGKVIGVKNKRK